jgi:lipopolysaccharide export system permease protein
MPFMIWTYVTKKWLAWVVWVSFAVLFLILLLDFSELARRASNLPHLSWRMLMKMVFLKALSLYHETLPFIMFIAGVVAFWRLHQSRELIPMKSGGVSPWQLMMPLIGVSGLLGVCDITFLQPLSAEFMEAHHRLEHRVFQKGKSQIALTNNGLWLRENMKNLQRIIYICHVDEIERSLKNVQIFESDQGDHFKNTYHAQYAYLDGPLLKMFDVWCVSPFKSPYHLKSLFLKTTFEFKGLKEHQAEPETLSFFELPSFIKMLERSGLSQVAYRLYWHSLIARIGWMMSLMVMVVALLGAIKGPHQGFRIFFYTGAGAFALYFLRDMSYALGKSQSLPILMAVWLPCLITMLLGAILVLYKEEG